MAKKKASKKGRRASTSQKLTTIQRESKRRREQILVILSKKPQLQSACDAVGINRTTLAKWRQQDPEYNEKVIEAQERAFDILEAEAMRRAVEGYDETTVDCVKGENGETREIKKVVRKYSDSLLQTLLKAKRPREYQRTNMNITTYQQNNFINGDGEPHSRLAPVRQKTLSRLHAIASGEER